MMGNNMLNAVTSDFPGLKFEPGDNFVWSPGENKVFYDETALSSDEGVWSLLHEIGHAKLKHRGYRDDLELLIMEVSAWKKAKEIAETYDVSISDDHIDNCIETYRSWLHSRSRCVECKTVSLQSDITTYQCHNCGTKWKVPMSRFCDVRRRRIKTSS